MAASEELARRVVEAGRSCSLTTAVLEEWSRLGTPKQVEYLAGYLEAERSSREASKRATLLRRCALPAPKTFDVSVNIIFTISTNAFSPIAPTRIRRIRQRGCAAFGA